MAVTQQTPATGSRRDYWRARLSGWRGDIGRAWSYPAVRRGFLGSALLFAGSLTPAYLPQNSPWWDPLRALGLDNWWARAFGTALVVAAVALLVEAWFKLRPSLYHEVKHWPITLLWSLPLLLAPPIFSHDAYAYAAEGWLLQNGLNPYDNPISVLPGPFADQAAWLWRYTTAMYPPLSLEMFHGLVILAGNDPYWSAVAMRIPALAGVALIAYFVPRLAHRIGADVQMAAWFSTVNPLVIIDLVGGAHNDALMMGLVVLSLWLAYQGKFWWAAILVGVAACIKQPAILAFYPVALIGHPWRTFRWRDTSSALLRLLLSFAVAVATFVAISLASGLGFGWVWAADVPGRVVTLAPFTLLGTGLQWVLTFFGQPDLGALVLTGTRYLGLLLTAVGIGWLGLTVGRRRPVTFLSWSYLIFAFGGIALNSWYLTWGGILLPLTKPTERIAGTAVSVTTVLLAYEAGNLSWRNDAVALGFAGLAVILVMLYQHHQERENHLAAQKGSR
ncbi:MAG: polyprenol phosphomannose-dependent alpha 1,6 mannosyltransferase MptB [Propionicimonas sp.]|uniref:polyprenol phosphomannose-dependent alpha 1,6 mannosyltransferase MptB n=1 Tax=Propionicimonas sp. TaxID=1955623 RepID=UPI003D0DBC1A